MKLNEGFPLVATAPDGIVRLRELILSLAVQGKLVPQDPSDEPADVLLEEIRREKDRLIAEGKIRRDKPLPEITYEEKPFDLPENWRWIRLGIAIELISGQHLGPSEYVDGLGSDIPYLTGPAEFGPCSPKPTRSTVVRRAVAARGDILITVKGSGVGKLNTVSQAEIAISRQLMAIRPILLNAHFVQLVLRAMGAVFQQKAVGIAIPGIGREDVTEAVIGLPPAAEQLRIVAKVDELMRLCDELETRGRLEGEQHARLTAALFDALAASESPHALAENWTRVAAHFELLLDRPEAVDALEQTILHLAVRGLLVPQDTADNAVDALLEQVRTRKDELVAAGKAKREKLMPAIEEEETPFVLPAGWKWVRLEQLLSKLGAGSTPLGGKDVYVACGIKFLRSQNVWNEGLRLEGAAFITPETHARMAGTVVLPGDILFNITGASIGRCAVVPGEFDEANVSQHVAIIRSLVSDITPYLHLVLISPHVQQTVMEVQVGVSREGLSMSKLGQFVIPLPPLAEQSRIVARVDEMRRLCAGLRERLTARQTCQARFAEAMADRVASIGSLIVEEGVELAA